MRTRESGMPDQATWEGFFRPDRMLERLDLTARCADVVDFGCGYGTFTLAAARVVSGLVHAIDIDPQMVESTRRRSTAEGRKNVVVEQRDVLETGTGLPAESIDYAMMFNNLHAEEPLPLLAEARRVLRPGGLLGIVHWRYDHATPRGPSMSIRLTSAQCQALAEQAGFAVRPPGVIDLPPFHFGLVCDVAPA